MYNIKQTVVKRTNKTKLKRKMNTNELASFGYTKSGRIRKTALKPKIALYGYTKSGRIRANPLKSQIYNICEDCGIKFDNEGWLTLKYCECCDDQRRSEENEVAALGALAELTKLADKQIARIERIRLDRAERYVDDRDSPNILPYKKCGFCHERSSCGSYTDEDVWQCEDCAPEEEEEYNNCICESNEKPNSLCIQHMCCFICSNQHSLIHLNQGTALWLCRECDDKGIWCRGCRNIIDEESGFCSTGCEYEGGISGGNVHDK